MTVEPMVHTTHFHASALTSLFFCQAMHLLVIIFFFSIPDSYGNPSIHPSYTQNTAFHPDDIPPNNYNLGREYYGQQPHTSYIIYDRDVNNVPGRPQMSSTRSWHLEFNQRKQNEQRQQSIPMAYSSIYSNLIQVYDKPQNKYYGEYDNNNYRPPNRDSYNYHIRSRPMNVPNYDVVYPYESERQNYYYREKLPENFPMPFLPDREFQFKDPVLNSDARKDYGYYHTQTVSYANQEDERTSRRDCNYIKLNEKGFPIGNEMCGRSISDFILSPDYPNTGELVLEHRKKYRGTNQDRAFESSSVNSLIRKKRNTENMSERFREFNSHNTNGGCCGENTRTGYGYQPQFRQDENRFMSRPYGGDRNIDGYGYRGQGQYDDKDDVGEETSDNHGLTSYLNRGRGNQGYEENEDSYGDKEENNSGSYGSRNGNRNGYSENRRNVGNSGNGSQGNNRRPDNRGNESSNRNGGNSETSNSQGDNRNVNNWRNFDRSNSEDDYSNRGGYNNQNERGNYGNFRNNDNGRNYYGQGFSGFRSDTGGNNRNSAPYGNNGFSAYNRFSR